MLLFSSKLFSVRDSHYRQNISDYKVRNMSCSQPYITINCDIYGLLKHPIIIAQRVEEREAASQDYFPLVLHCLPVYKLPLSKYRMAATRAITQAYGTPTTLRTTPTRTKISRAISIAVKFMAVTPC